MSNAADVSEDATTVFELLADDTRYAIVAALVESFNPNDGTGGRRFSDLRQAVGVEDGGRFNYHLDRLRGAFVRQDGETYYPTPAAFRATEMANATEPATDPRTGRLDERAPCGERLHAFVWGGVVDVTCPKHDTYRFRTFVPPRLPAGRTLDETVAAAGRHTGVLLDTVTTNVCPRCGSTLDYGAFEEYEGVPAVPVSCPHCWWEARFTLATRGVRDAATVAFYAALGRDIDAEPIYRTVADTAPEVSVDDNATVRFEEEGRTLELTYDSSLTRLDARRNGDPVF
ncbi:winged helix-turn-helix domain-containing protein [Salarchaeum sp. III]|uniref:winged helix-turn-helix domain-containing protein n=1 Tax=Salarchaeum sp. III TaxID=3107927 RepID=UPI002EDABC97